MSSDPKPTLGSGKKKKGSAPTRKPLGVSAPSSTSPGYLAPGGYFPAPGKTETPLNFGFGVVTPAGVAAVHGLHNISNAWDQGVAPRYFKGDEMAPLNLPPTSPDGNDISTIQHQLIVAGFLKGTYQVGSFDAATQTAYKNALVAANKAGVTYADIIAAGSQGGGKRVNASTGKEVGASGTAPLQVQLTSPQDLEATLQGVAQKLYGGNLPADAVQKFVSSYQQMESTAQQNAYSTNTAGGTYTAPPNVTDASQNFIKTTFPADYAAAGVGERFDQWTNLLNSTMSGGEGQAQH